MNTPFGCSDSQRRVLKIFLAITFPLWVIPALIVSFAWFCIGGIYGEIDNAVEGWCWRRARKQRHKEEK